LQHRAACAPQPPRPRLELNRSSPGLGPNSASSFVIVPTAVAFTSVAFGVAGEPQLQRFVGSNASSPVTGTTIEPDARSQR